MKYKIHFTIGGIEDSFIIEGETIELITIDAKEQAKLRGLDEEKNNLWSEKIK